MPRVSHDAPGRVLACPGCDRAGDIYRRTGTGNAWQGDRTAEYRCQKCGATFAEPVEREAKCITRGPVSDDELIADVRRVCEQFNSGVTTAEYSEHGDHSTSTVTRRIGWNEAVRRAGFVPIDPNGGGPARYGRILQRTNPADLGLSPLGGETP